jgi:uncharacterized protein YbcI
MIRMDSPARTKAQRIATAAAEFETRRTGHSPTSVTVVLTGETLVITLHGALSPAECAVANKPNGAAELQQYRRNLFESAATTFRQEIKEITGVEINEESPEVEPVSGTVVSVFSTGTVVQVYLLAKGLPTDIWPGNDAPMAIATT